MRKRVLVLMTSAVVLACGTFAASAQQSVPNVPMIQDQPQVLQRQDLERLLQRLQSLRRGNAEDDADQDDSGYRGGGMGPRWRFNQDGDRGGMGRGMMGREGATGPIASGMMMRMLFSLMDSDGDGTVSLQEFQAAHERIFRAMDANKDGKLTLEEIQVFLQGVRRPVQRP
jgi:EF hand